MILNKINLDLFTEEQKQFLLSIAMFNTDKDYMMICPDEETKEKMLSVIDKKRLDDVLISNIVTDIIMVRKEMTFSEYYKDYKYQYGGKVING